MKELNVPCDHTIQLHILVCNCKMQLISSLSLHGVYKIFHSSDSGSLSKPTLFV